jgi:hypothetical protein
VNSRLHSHSQGPATIRDGGASQQGRFELFLVSPGAGPSGASAGACARVFSAAGALLYESAAAGAACSGMAAAGAAALPLQAARLRVSAVGP